MMYNPKKYLTKDIVIKELAKYYWASSLVINDEDCTVDGIRVHLPKCIIYFREGFESNITAYIANPSLVKVKYWAVFDVVNLSPIKNIYPPLNLINDEEAFASLEKVVNGVKDICATINYYLQPFIDGDFSSIENEE